jgi:hypothetical protein
LCIFSCKNVCIFRRGIISSGRPPAGADDASSENAIIHNNPQIIHRIHENTMSEGADNISLELKIHNNPQIIHRIH